MIVHLRDQAGFVKLVLVHIRILVFGIVVTGESFGAA